MAELQDSIFDLIKEVLASSDIRSDSAVGAWKRLRSGWSGYVTRYEGLPPFPDVKLTFVDPHNYEVSDDEIRNTLPLFEVEAEVPEKRPGEEEKMIHFSGNGTTFAAAVGHLLDRIHVSRAQVWQGTLDVYKKSIAEHWTYLQEHPFFGAKTSACIRIREELDTSYPWPQPVYVLEAGPYRPHMGYDSFLHVSAPTLSGALSLLVERIKRVYDGQTVLVSADQLKQAHTLLKEYGIYNRVEFRFSEEGVQVAWEDGPEALADGATFCLSIGARSYEEVLIRLAEEAEQFRKERSADAEK